MRYPNRLSSGANNIVIALSETEVAKLFVGDTRSDIGSEAEKMKYANGMNDLVVKFVRLDEFEDELYQLHKVGFSHRDHLKRPSGIGGQYFDYILLTENGLQLIDLGISALRELVGDKIFEKYQETERKEMAGFREFFLNR